MQIFKEIFSKLMVISDSSTSGGTQRSLEQTPTWAVAAVCFVLLTVSIVIEFFIHLLGKWLRKTSKRPLYEALEKIKAELMLLGFISLLLTVIQNPVSRICIPKSVGRTWHPCSSDDEDDQKYDDTCLEKGKMQFVSTDGLHQLHIFIFVLALFHVLYCIMTLGFGTLKMMEWKAWEDETKTLDYQFYNDPERFRFARDTTFGRRHLHFWTKSPIILWIVCFFRQFIVSVAKVDYLTLRHGFVMAHLSPNSHASFDFQKYISRTLTEDFKVVVGISPIIWLLAVLFLLCNAHGSYSYYWLPFIPLAIILIVGAKLEMIITKMGLRIQDRGDVVKGTPVVKPGDDLFWFNRPRLLLFLIHFVLFQNAFQLAFLTWSWYQFGIPSCFHNRPQDIAIRLSMGILIQLLCSYVTLPLYALVTQMGMTMKPAIFNDKVASALKSWHNAAKRHIKESSRHPSESPTPLTSSPIHLLQGYRNSTIDHDYDHSQQTSPRERKPHYNGDEDPEPSRSHHEISISLTDISFVEKST